MQSWDSRRSSAFMSCMRRSQLRNSLKSIRRLLGASAKTNGGKSCVRPCGQQLARNPASSPPARSAAPDSPAPSTASSPGRRRKLTPSSFLRDTARPASDWRAMTFVDQFLDGGWIAQLLRLLAFIDDGEIPPRSNAISKSPLSCLLESLPSSARSAA